MNTKKKRKAYREIKKTDKFPELPSSVKARYILRKWGKTLVFAESADERYTFVWDGVSSQFNECYIETK